MNNFNKNPFLLMAWVLSTSLLVASESEPSKLAKRQRLVVPSARERDRLSVLRNGQFLVDKMQVRSREFRWVNRFPSEALILVGEFLRMSQFNPSIFDLIASDGRSMPFMVSQYPQLSDTFAWLWAELPGKIKKKEVAFHESLDGFDGNTLLHNLIAAKNKSMVKCVLDLNQDLLRPNSVGQIPAFFAGDSLGEVSHLLKEKTYAQWERRVDSIGMIPRPLSILVVSMIAGDLGPGYRA